MPISIEQFQDFLESQTDDLAKCIAYDLLYENYDNGMLLLVEFFESVPMQLQKHILMYFQIIENDLEWPNINVVANKLVPYVDTDVIEEVFFRFQWQNPKFNKWILKFFYYFHYESDIETMVKI